MADGSCILLTRGSTVPVTMPVRAEADEPRRPHRSPAVLVRAGVLLAMLAGLAALTSRTGDGWLCDVDARISSLVARRRGTAVIRAAHAVSALAEPAAVAAPLAAATVLAVRKDGWHAAFKPFGTVITGMAVRRGLSRMIARPRPPGANWLIAPEGFSLPSKHTTLAALTAGACALGVGAGPHASDRAVLVAASGIGASRICLGVHWPSDVLAGWLFAAAWLDVVRALPARDQRSRRWPGVDKYEPSTASGGLLTGRTGQ
jgi:membrane-associated phospholipid phosphatase